MYQFSTTLSNQLFSHIDSISANENVDVVEELSYDPWGNRRFHANWAQPDYRTSFITNRGFTGHEHLDVFGLINANARMYEPATGRFLTADPYVQAPDFSQNFNRYSYVLNNPLKYTDPSGDSFMGIMEGLVNILTAPARILSGLQFGFGEKAWGYIAGTHPPYSISDPNIIRGLVDHSWFYDPIGSFGPTLADNSLLVHPDILNEFLIKQEMKILEEQISSWYTKYLKIEVGEGMEYSNDYANKFYIEMFGYLGITALNKIYADGSLPNSNYYKYGDYVYSNYSGTFTRGTCSPSKGKKGKYDIFLYKSAFTSKEQLYLTMGHELLHVYFYSKNMNLSKAQHATIYQWQYTQARIWDYKVNEYKHLYDKHWNYNLTSYNYSNSGIFFISTKPNFSY